MSASQAFADYFRCADSSCRFELIEKASSAPGYFKFGPNAICFGRVAVGFGAADVRAELHDAYSDVQVRDGKYLLPFDPDEIVDNLRRERYVASESEGGDRRSSFRDALVRNAYYAIRPLLPVSVRKHLQRTRLKGWRDKAFPRWPLERSVDRLLEQLMILELQSRGVDKIPFIWFWPEGKSACAIMTHDVETKAGLQFCPSLMDITDSHGLKSSFQVIPGGRYEAEVAILDEIRRRGFEVNVHDWNHDGHLFSSRELFLERIPKINEAAKKFQAVGFRAAVLYRNTDWYDALGFAYDMSVPNVGHLDPQPGGCCTTMPYFIGDVLEFPLTTIQDYSLFHILQDCSINIWKQQARLILEGNGLISFIVHPDYVIAKREQAVYEQLLAHLASLGREENVWLALPREVNSWWRSRSLMKLVQHNGQWKVEGPGADRARVAFASLRGSRLNYTVAAEDAHQKNVANLC